MKIALLSFEYPLETGFGGIGTYTWYQARALVKLGHEVHVLAGATAPTGIRTTTHDGVVVHRFHADGRFLRLVARTLDRRQLWWTKNRLKNGLSMHRGLRALMRRHTYDIVEMPECGAEGWLVNHLTALPTVLRFHSPSRLIMPFYDVRRADMRLCSFLEQVAISGARTFTACSRFLAAEARDRLGIRRAIHVIPNGIDLDLFDAEEQTDIRRQFGLPRTRPLVLFAGRMERRKGIELCRDIVAPIVERHEVSFVFAGQDVFGVMADMLPELTRRARRGSVHYVGRLTLTQVRSCLRQSDVFLLPSLWENCPYSCLEAMAAGRAIVSSDQGGMPELIRSEENGLLARNGQPESYVRQLERLIEDAALRERLGAAARRTVEASFTDLHVARQSIACYRGVLAGTSALTDTAKEPART